MARTELLNNVDHQNIKVRTQKSAEFGDDQMLSLTFPAEFRTAQAYYPIVLHKDAQTGQFYPVTLFGFQAGENLFLNADGWQSGYVPLAIERHPFSIGQQNGQRVIHIDMESPRVSTDEGEPLFLEFGGNTPYLQRVGDMLETLHHGVEDNKKFIEMLNEFDLIESFSLDITLNNGAEHRLLGFYTINEDKLAALGAEQMSAIHQSGYLFAIYMMLASQSQFAKLVAMKNQQIEQA
ncbi:SapC family protein [Pseudoalteromonas sp. SSDWG2]|uniref:SapC family protein n=1 Tax=Pseudoalteromonas sp. SSDWG2 TaxID=3139391 RepID=UPI003BADA762